MKHLLFGSTALVAIGLLAPAAQAADGIALHIGGRYMGAAGIVPSEDFSASSDIDNNDVRDYVFKQDVRVYFEGESTLDNGLQVGARVDLRGQTDTEDQIRDVYAYFSGGFGEVRFGDTAEAYTQMCYLVPSASGIFGADSPNFNFSNAGIAGAGATNGTCYGIDSNSTKVVYFSPSFGGFQFAASFTPDNTEDTRNTVNGAATRLRNDPGQNSENLGLAGTFKHDFNGVSLVAGGGTSMSFNKEANPDNVSDARSYNGYMQVGFSGFTLGASTELRDNFGDTSADQWVYGAGGTYNWDAWTVGLGWTHGDYEKVIGANGVGTAEGGFNADHDIISATASYALGPGIQIDGVVEYSDYHSRNAAGPDYQGVGAGLGTLITF
ncbi:MAG TPA: porin [Candidatus Angelobacter sp.]|nr:porin [Candidatus Angelobacter sp.]